MCNALIVRPRTTDRRGPRGSYFSLAQTGGLVVGWATMPGAYTANERGIGNSVHAESDSILFSSRFAPSGCLAISLDHHHTLPRQLSSSGVGRGP